eukprot:2832231-Pyramimonas_sp.AAC.1
MVDQPPLPFRPAPHLSARVRCLPRSSRPLPHLSPPPSLPRVTSFLPFLGPFLSHRPRDAWATR